MKVPESSEMYNFQFPTSHASHATRQKPLNSCRPSCSMQTGLWLLIIFTVLVRCPGFPFFKYRTDDSTTTDWGWWPPLPPTPKIGRGVYTQWSGWEKTNGQQIIGEKKGSEDGEVKKVCQLKMANFHRLYEWIFTFQIVKLEERTMLRFWGKLQFSGRKPLKLEAALSANAAAVINVATEAGIGWNPWKVFQQKLIPTHQRKGCVFFSRKRVLYPTKHWKTTLFFFQKRGKGWCSGTRWRCRWGGAGRYAVFEAGRFR